MRVKTKRNEIIRAKHQNPEKFYLFMRMMTKTMRMSMRMRIMMMAIIMEYLFLDFMETNTSADIKILLTVTMILFNKHLNQ